MTSIASNKSRIWRVFYTNARAEKKCERILNEQDVEVFLPKCEVVRQWKDRKKKVVEPLFRNYIFAQVNERERLDVLKMPGIVRTVSFGGTLAVVRDDEMEQLKIAQQAPRRLSLLTFPLPEIGEEVTITEAPLRGLRGQVIEHRGQTHLILHVSAIRQAVRVNIPAEWVQTDRCSRAA